MKTALDGGIDMELVSKENRLGLQKKLAAKAAAEPKAA
jgi:hypothetical protein